MNLLIVQSPSYSMVKKGKLYKKGDVLADVSSTLRAGDILLEKTPFRLTDKLIPGYWGHAAVWIGTESTALVFCASRTRAARRVLIRSSRRCDRLVNLMITTSTWNPRGGSAIHLHRAWRS